MTRGRRISLALMALAALGMGLAEPYAEVAWKCRAGFETTEACVWGRAYMPLGRVVALVVITPASFVVLLALNWGWRRFAGASSPGERTM